MPMLRYFTYPAYLEMYENTNGDITLVYSTGPNQVEEGKFGTLMETGQDASNGWSSFNSVPWYSKRNKVKRVVVYQYIEPYDMSAFFATLPYVTEIEGLNNVETTSCTNFYQMFYGATKITSLDLSDWNTKYVTNMKEMFCSCSKLANINMSGWQTTDVTTMQGMFMLCKALTKLDLSSFTTYDTDDTQAMFRNCVALKTIYASENFTNRYITTSSNMFTSCSALVGGNGTVYNANNVDATYARLDTVSTPGYFSVKPLPIAFNNGESNITAIYFNGQEVTSLYYNNTLIFGEGFKPEITINIQVTSTPSNGENYRVGDEIDYTISVTNTSVFPFYMSECSLTSELTGDVWNMEGIDPGQTRTFDINYIITSSDIEVGSVDIRSGVSFDGYYYDEETGGKKYPDVILTGDSIIPVN